MRFKILLGATLLAGIGGPFPARAEEKPKVETAIGKPVEIPYRLTDTQHVLVRVKINGKGPFNFIIDTGAPAFIMTEAVAKKVGAKSEKPWVTFDKVELEGGLVIPNPKGIATDMFQLKGMNAMGLAGCELHGVIGYNILAQYRIQYDFTATKLVWTPVKFEVPAPKRISKPEDKAEMSGQGGLELMGDLMAFLARFGGIKPNYDYRPRGFVGIELEEKAKDLIVKTVLADSPAAKAGLKVGDKILIAKGKPVDSADDLLNALSKLPVGTKVKLNVKSGEESREVTIELGKGL
ncbi:PDZ domain-containing protein [Zavarzinella formosa]|uniref:PDZ domain-containing protein n=1 Tax=Zavarzinella formosa TaxID=360055 RepID=UPI0002E8077E|nr:PDZ domain-containing protein [Zavarzinella formosa]